MVNSYRLLLLLYLLEQTRKRRNEHLRRIAKYRHMWRERFRRFHHCQRMEQLFFIMAVLIPMAAMNTSDSAQ